MLYLLCSCLYVVVFPFQKLLLTLRIRDVLSGCHQSNVYCNTPLSEYDIIRVQYFVTTYVDQCGHGCIVVAKLMISTCWPCGLVQLVLLSSVLHCSIIVVNYCVYAQTLCHWRLLLNCTTVTVSTVRSIQRTRKINWWFAVQQVYSLTTKGETHTIPCHKHQWQLSLFELQCTSTLQQLSTVCAHVRK